MDYNDLFIHNTGLSQIKYYKLINAAINVALSIQGKYETFGYK